MPSAPSAPPEVQAALQAVGSSNALTLRVVDVFSERKALAGQRVKVAGTVDRVNTVQGVHYVHVKDGTGVAADKTDDLLVLSQVEVAKGANVTAEGVVAIDRDVGMGSVAVLLDQAQVK
jgi:aspartyl/asparaginyl-tRNA synthetase